MRAKRKERRGSVRSNKENDRVVSEEYKNKESGEKTMRDKIQKSKEAKRSCK